MLQASLNKMPTLASNQQSFDNSGPASANPLQVQRPEIEPIEESKAQEEENAD